MGVPGQGWHGPPTKEWTTRGVLPRRENGSPRPRQGRWVSRSSVQGHEYGLRDCTTPTGAPGHQGCGRTPGVRTEPVDVSLPRENSAAGDGATTAGAPTSSRGEGPVDPESRRDGGPARR